MARIYDVVCLKCGEVKEWCKYDPPFDKCDFCGSRLTDRLGDWDERKVWVSGVWSTNRDVEELSDSLRKRFFEERGGQYRFRLKDRRLCIVTRPCENDVYKFSLKTGGERVILIYNSSVLSEAVNLLRRRKTAIKVGLFAVRYKDAFYFHPNVIEKILRAIHNNLKPEVEVVIE